MRNTNFDIKLEKSLGKSGASKKKQKELKEEILQLAKEWIKEEVFEILDKNIIPRGVLYGREEKIDLEMVKKQIKDKIRIL